MQTNHLTCQSAALAGGPAATRVTRAAARALSMLRFNGLAPPPPAEPTPLQECCSVLAYLQVRWGLG